MIKIYLLFAGAGCLVFMATGMPPFDALLHIMSTVSTSGFSTTSKSIGQYQNSAITAGVSLFMILGAIGFPTYYALYHRGLKPFVMDPQVLYLPTLILVFSILVAGLPEFPQTGWISGYFHVTSALTTTGFSTLPSSGWRDGFKWITVFLMTVGGCAGSTAGG